MPPVIPAIITGVALAAGGAGLTGALVGGLAVGALSLFSSVMAPRSKPAASLRGLSETVRQAAAPRRILYGRRRVGGTIIFMHTNDLTGWAIGNVLYTDPDDLPPPTPFFQWDPDRPSHSYPNATLHMIIAFAGHEVDAIEEVWFDETKLDLEAVPDKAGAYRPKTGTPYDLPARGPWDADDAREAILLRPLPGSEDPQPIPELTAVDEDLWDPEIHKLRSIAALYVRLPYDVTAFGNGIPNITCLIRGKRVYDPRTSATAWSRNPALIAADYLTDVPHGFAAGTDEIDWDSVAAAANYCEATVEVTENNFEPRFQADGVIDTSRPIGENLLGILSAMGGYACWEAGQWNIHPARWTEPDQRMITPSDLRGPIEVQTTRPAVEIFNVVKGLFSGPASEWQPDDFPPYKNPDHIERDQREIAHELDLPFTIDPAACQRLAKITLERQRREITVKLRVSLVGLRYRIGDNLMLKIPRYGWDGHVFQVIEREFVPNNSEDGPTLEVALTLQANAPEIYEWNLGETIPYIPAKNTQLGFLAQPPAPAGISATISPRKEAGGVLWFCDVDIVPTWFPVEIEVRRFLPPIWEPWSTTAGIWMHCGYDHYFYAHPPLGLTYSDLSSFVTAAASAGGGGAYQALIVSFGDTPPGPNTPPVPFSAVTPPLHDPNQSNPNWHRDSENMNSQPLPAYFAIRIRERHLPSFVWEPTHTPTFGRTLINATPRPWLPPDGSREDTTHQINIESSTTLPSGSSRAQLAVPSFGGAYWVVARAVSGGTAFRRYSPIVSTITSPDLSDPVQVGDIELLDVHRSHLGFDVEIIPGPVESDILGYILRTRELEGDDNQTHTHLDIPPDNLHRVRRHTPNERYLIQLALRSINGGISQYTSPALEARTRVYDSHGYHDPWFVDGGRATMWVTYNPDAPAVTGYQRADTLTMNGTEIRGKLTYQHAHDWTDRFDLLATANNLERNGIIFRRGTGISKPASADRPPEDWSHSVPPAGGGNNTLWCVWAPNMAGSSPTGTWADGVLLRLNRPAD